MEDKQKLSRFRFKEGPTSPAVGRSAAILGESSPTQAAISSPAGYINMQNETLKDVAQKLGKSVNDFSETERSGVAKYWVWKTKNPQATKSDMEAQFNAIFPRVKAKSDFSDQ